MQFRFEGNSVILFKRLPAFKRPGGSESRVFGNFRYAVQRRVVLYWRDRNQRWLRSHRMPPSPAFADLLNEVDADPSRISWGQRLVGKLGTVGEAAVQSSAVPLGVGRRRIITANECSKTLHRHVQPVFDLREAILEEALLFVQVAVDIHGIFRTVDDRVTAHPQEKMPKDCT